MLKLRYALPATALLLALAGSASAATNGVPRNVDTIHTGSTQAVRLGVAADAANLPNGNQAVVNYGPDRQVSEEPSPGEENSAGPAE